jgi:hypothetical protein
MRFSGAASLSRGPVCIATMIRHCSVCVLVAFYAFIAILYGTRGEQVLLHSHKSVLLPCLSHMALVPALHLP